MAPNYHRSGYTLQRPKYEVMSSSVTRSVHIGEVGRIYNKKKLFAHRIISRKVDHDMKVVWFSPTVDMSEHNKYGNVSFTIDLDDTQEVVGSNFYYLDQEITKTHVYTRVLLTNRIDLHYERVGEHNDNTPIAYDTYNQRLLAVSCYANRKCMQHVLEVGVECYEGICRQLYEFSKVEVNNHAEANQISRNGRYSRLPCHRFNFFNNTCPSSFSEEKAQRKIITKFPGLLKKSNDNLKSIKFRNDGDDTAIIECGEHDLSSEDYDYEESDDEDVDVVISESIRYISSDSSGSRYDQSTIPTSTRSRTFEHQLSLRTPTSQATVSSDSSGSRYDQSTTPTSTMSRTFEHQLSLRTPTSQATVSSDSSGSRHDQSTTPTSTRSRNFEHQLSLRTPTSQETISPNPRGYYENLSSRYVPATPPASRNTSQNFEYQFGSRPSASQQSNDTTWTTVAIAVAGAVIVGKVIGRLWIRK